MKKILTILAVLAIATGFGQTTLRKSSLSSGGGSVTSGSYYMAYALGEIGVQEATTGSTHLSEGFIGPDIAAIMGIEDYTQLEGVNVYPNPIKTDLNIELPDYQNYEVSIYDMSGKLVFKSTIEDDNHATFNLSNLKTGLYVMAIVDRENNKAKTIKLQKL